MSWFVIRISSLPHGMQRLTESLKIFEYLVSRTFMLSQFLCFLFCRVGFYETHSNLENKTRRWLRARRPFEAQATSYIRDLSANFKKIRKTLIPVYVKTGEVLLKYLNCDSKGIGHYKIMYEVFTPKMGIL